MNTQHLNYLNTLDKGELVNIISGLEREISDNKVRKNSIEAVTDSEYAIIKALREMMDEHIQSAFKVHNNDKY